MRCWRAHEPNGFKDGDFKELRGDSKNPRERQEVSVGDTGGFLESFRQSLGNSGSFEGRFMEKHAVFYECVQGLRGFQEGFKGVLESFQGDPGCFRRRFRGVIMFQEFSSMNHGASGASGFPEFFEKRFKGVSQGKMKQRLNMITRKITNEHIVVSSYNLLVKD